MQSLPQSRPAYAGSRHHLLLRQQCSQARGRRTEMSAGLRHGLVGLLALCCSIATAVHTTGEGTQTGGVRAASCSGVLVAGGGTSSVDGCYVRHGETDGAPRFQQQQQKEQQEGEQGGIMRPLQLYRFQGRWNLGIDGNFSLYTTRCQSSLPLNKTGWARTCTVYNYSCSDRSDNAPKIFQREERLFPVET